MSIGLSWVHIRWHIPPLIHAPFQFHPVTEHQDLYVALTKHMIGAWWLVTLCLTDITVYVYGGGAVVHHLLKRNWLITQADVHERCQYDDAKGITTW